MDSMSNIQNKILTLDDISHYSTEEIVALYGQGYRLEDTSKYINNESIYPMQAFPIDISCVADIRIFVGSTLTAPWGYVWKVQDINLDTRVALVKLLLDGNEIDSKTMVIGDSSILTNPSNNIQHVGMFVTNVFIGKEIRTLIVSYCQWTQQTSTIDYISIPGSFKDGESHSIIGRLTKSITGPIVGEKVYITENGTRISEAITGTDGLFTITFVFHKGFSYSILYPGTVAVNGVERSLAGYEVPGATHMIRYKYAVAIPDSITTIFRTIASPLTELVKFIPVGAISGWEILDIKISSTQISVYAKQTGSVSAETFALVTIVAIVGMLVAELAELPIVGWATAALIVGFLLYVTYDVVCIETIPQVCDFVGKIVGGGEKKPTPGDVNNNIDGPEGIGAFLGKCKKDYDAADKSTPALAKDACLKYVQCQIDAYAGMIQYAKGYLFPKAMNDLSKIADQLKTNARNECIVALEQDKITCDQAITCAQQRGQDAMSSSSNTVYIYYPKDQPYTPPWEKEKEKPGAGLGWIVTGALILGGVFVVYKVVTSGSGKEKTIVEIRTPEERRK